MIELIDIKDRRRMHRLIYTYSVLIALIYVHLQYYSKLFNATCHIEKSDSLDYYTVNDFTSKVILKIIFFKRPKKNPNLILIIISLVVNKKVQRHIIFLPRKHVLLHF